MPLTLLTATLSLLNTSVQASEALDFSFLPRVVLLSLINQEIVTNFNAINHTLITETADPQAPSPGDTFLTNGFGVLDTPFNNIELSYSYNIAGTFTAYDQEQDKLLFNHGFAEPGVTNQLMLYFDTTPDADEDVASSYTNGIKIATMDVVVDNNDAIGYIGLFSGVGEDKVTFKLSDSDLVWYGFSSDTVLLNKITTNITFVDFVGGQPQGFDFGAFGSDCEPLENPYNSCSREVGTSKLVLSPVPIPASLGLFLSGFGLLGWLKKRK